VRAEAGPDAAAAQRSRAHTQLPAGALADHGPTAHEGGLPGLEGATPGLHAGGNESTRA